MEYQFREIEQKWQRVWREKKTYQVNEDPAKKKYYALDMFPYPSGAGLHVGHPLGYIASDIIARYKRHQGYNVLHPMGYDSFGLPAEQYAIQTGQHPEITTNTNINRYREQLDKIGFAYDWDREVRTSSPEYYRWTQWIFGLIYDSWFNLDTGKAEKISSLVEKFETNGNYNVNAAIDDQWFTELDLSKFPFFSKDFSGAFSATDWKSMTEEQQQLLLMHYRLAYLADSWVNWCPALGTVLANDEVKDGRSERGGHPVEQKKMRQWSMRITAYAQRLLDGLDTIDWPENIKEVQRNWIGRSEGASVRFRVDGHDADIEVFTTRPDTIFGVSFMTLAPEHELVPLITTDEYRDGVEKYMASARLKTERDRQSDAKNITGQFTGAHVIHPFTGEKIPVWIGEYVLAGYGTGAVMAVPAGDQRDWDFARKFGLSIPQIFADTDISEKAESSKDARLCNSQMLDGLSYQEAMPKIISEIEKLGIGTGKINYRMRDAVFSRQRYWGEPFPVYYKNEIPYLCDDDDLPVVLPEVDKYLPTEDGEPPLARAKDWFYEFETQHYRMEYNTMPGWAGSSWYFLRYMDPHNEKVFADRNKVDYWNQVDLYMGGAEHATGHLLYSRFWTKVLFDHGYIGFDEPFKKMINQGMILGRSNTTYRYCNGFAAKDQPINWEQTNILLTKEISERFFQLGHAPTPEEFDQILAQQLGESKAKDIRKGIMGVDKRYVDISLVDNDELDIKAFKSSLFGNEDDIFILNENNKYICGYEVEKMSKSKFNVQTPDELVEKFGADTLRLYEMFLGPVEQSKPWDTKGINGVHNFLRKFWRLAHDRDNHFAVQDIEPTPAELRVLHTAIKKVTEDLNRYSWNTVVSTMMICVNELTELKSSNKKILSDLVVLLSPYAPHFAEELWEKLGHTSSVVDALWPAFDEKHLVVDSFDYPVSFNGKTRFNIELGISLSQDEVTQAVLNHELTAKYLEGKQPKKVIVVPKRIVNVVV
ncbi:MAG: leucine--tRNA ligase [Flavobacteriales bacterium]|nr:leucine--tRNA ligase [Flavobacteriales bacterium]